MLWSYRFQSYLQGCLAASWWLFSLQTVLGEYLKNTAWENLEQHFTNFSECHRKYVKAQK